MRTKPVTLVSVIAIPIAIALATAGCGGSASDKAAEPAATVAHVKVFAFRPTPLKVPAGSKVTWINDDDITHTVTSGTRTYEPGDTGKVVSTQKDGQFDMALEGAGKKGSFTFAKAGTFHYFCDRHPGMEADVVVQ
ncbi:MAG: hypothetical protein QOK43_2449 [Acidimicrobiaceae bacterium]|nr:hypothetical protein [Acidimicrobiaceae bacterium]